jgi:hypothetical protein
MKKIILSLAILMIANLAVSQTNPAITAWLQNNTVMGTYYVSGNSTAITNNILVNCQTVQYGPTNVFVSTKGIPAYPTGPFLDNNPSVASDQSAIYKFTLNPTEETGTKTSTTGGNIGVFINGVSLFDYRDGVAWNNTTSALCGGPGNPPCPGTQGTVQDWNRDAIPAEMGGFDCSKGHPANGNYHHHQNPSAFKLDKVVLSTICNLYDADGLYTIDSNSHSPLIGFAYDGFPIYGAYAYADTNGTGAITRMKSGYELGTATTRTNGPAVNATYFNGYFREDYQFVAHPTDVSYLDEHNGRWNKTPEYPNGTYAYFATVDANYNSAYPYAVGPTFYGVYTRATVTTVPSSATTYISSVGINEEDFKQLDVTVFPNPASDLIAIQFNDLVKNNFSVDLYNVNGKLVKSSSINKGQTISYFDVEDVYSGLYFVKISNGDNVKTIKVVIEK